jgi:hypothetical protein
MLRFDDSFRTDRRFGCLLWADEPKMERVCFYIGPTILQDVLHGGNLVHDAANGALCDKERPRIEPACGFREPPIPPYPFSSAWIAE